MFDAAHGTAPDIAGQDKANPTAILLAFSMLLAHIGDTGPAEAIRAGLFDCIDEGETTGDLGGPHGTESFTQALITRVRNRLESEKSK
jgi:isocitrate dehydrogenase (NAD+)